ncbi:MAG: PKD domain-containing protein, partial [Terriglobales bacterium]
RGEYTTANATQFPHGMWRLEHRIRGLGLIPGVWTAPFEVSARAWVYQHHPDWLLHDAHGQPILVGYVHGHVDPLYVLDTTNPGAQRYLRRTYRILTRQWGVRYIKLDFMDAAAVEGDYYRPGTTAIQAQRLGLRIIRQGVGPQVLLDKDGSLMLPPVGFVNEGRIAPDTGHSFAASRDAVTNIASRFYMNRNFFVADPDAFSVSRQIEPQQQWHESQSGLTRNEAQVQIVLAAMAGGMFEIGDDLPTLAAEPRRLALVENQQIIDLNRLGRSALPLDLMTFPLQDAAPSVFYLREDRRQAMLAVFNWTGHSTSHRIGLAQLGFPQGDRLRAYDVLDGDVPVAFAGGALRIRAQAPRSVRLIELDDAALPPRPPNVTAEAPAAAGAGQAITLQAHLAAGSPPAMSYRWDFGDGTSAAGPNARHTYTHAGTFSVTLTARGLAGVQGARTAVRHLTIRVTGFPRTRFTLRQNRRYRPVQ